MLLGIGCWIGLVVALSISTFGLGKCLLIILCVIICVIGAIITLYLRHKYTAVICQSLLENSMLEPPRTLIQVSSKNPVHKLYRHDRRLTGSSIIDEPLQEVLHYAFRDYIHTWYNHISSNEEFLVAVKEVVQKVLHYAFRDYIHTWYNHISSNEEFLVAVKEVVQKVIIAFSSRSKDVDWVQYLTTKLVDEFASHLRLFRQAQSKLKDTQRKDPTSVTSLLSLFFDFETAMEDNLCRDLVCISKKNELDYLHELGEAIMYLLLPPEDFQNMMSRFLIREIVVNAAVLPVVDLVSDPDYINQIIVWLCKDTILTSDGYLLVLRCTDNINELQAVQEIVSHEIAVQRSKDTGGDDDAEIKQQLSSLSYVRKVVEARLRRLHEGNLDTDSTGMPTDIDWKQLTEPGVKLFSLHFDVVLTNNIALHYYTEFMTALGAQGYVFFYHSVESFKVSAEQMLSQIQLVQITQSSATPPDLENIREAALHIFDLYLSDKATLKVRLDETLLKKLLCRIRTERPNSTWFDEAQVKVYETMQEEQYFPTFKKGQSYIKLLAELDLLKEVNIKAEEDAIFCSGRSGSRYTADDLSLCDSISLSSLDQEEYGLDYLTSDTLSAQGRASPSALSDEVNMEDIELSAHIYNTGIANDAGTTYAVYAIAVTKKYMHGSEDRWCVLRRYSDFRDFYLSLGQKFPQLSNLQFPGKKTFNNLSPQFLEKRTSQLSEYLQCLLNPDTLNSNPGLKSVLLHFLEPKIYEKGKKPLAKTVGAIVSPLKSSVKTVGHMVKAVPDTLMDGLKDGLVRVLGSRGASPINQTLPGSSKVAAGLDVEGDDNIPLRILLLLMDEVFDLKSKDQWFRKRIVILLRQIINATYGDTINRKILDYVQWTTSAEQMAEYIKAFKQAMWPNGSLALPRPERDQNTKMRSRVAAKLVMLCSLPDELKHVIGSETTRKGVLCVFEMFQHPELNRRLFYVILEGILETLFPENNIPLIIRRLHSRSTHTTFDESKWPQTSPVIQRKIDQNR